MSEDEIQREKNKTWCRQNYLKNKVRRLKYQSRYYADNRESILEQHRGSEAGKKWRTENREKLLAYCRKWRAENLAANKAYFRRYYIKNRESLLKERRESYANDPTYRAKSIAAAKASRAKNRR